MKKVSILGVLGLGNFSTLFYIGELNRIYQMRMKGYSTFPFKMLNVNFDAINNLLPNPSTQLEVLVEQAIAELVELKVDVILVPNITLHDTIDKLKLNVQVIHPLKCTLNELRKKKCHKIVLIASHHTMNSDYIKSYFTKNNIEVILPFEQEMYFIDSVRKEVYENTASLEMLEKYNSIVQQYAEKFSVVTACTELSLALKNPDMINVFDMSRIQIQKAMEETVEF